MSFAACCRHMPAATWAGQWKLACPRLPGCRSCLLEKMIRQPRTALGIAKRRGDAQDFQLRRPEGQGNGKRIVNVVPDICIYDGLLRAEPAGGKEEKGNDAQQGSPDHETSLLRVADLPEAAILALHDVMARRRGIVFASQHRAV